VSKTTEKQINLVDETIRMKEELLQKISEGQSYLEQSLISEMRQQYHEKIENLQKHMKILEKERDFALNKPINTINPLNSGNIDQNTEKSRFLSLNKQKMQELETQLRDFKKKEKLQLGLSKQVSSQKNQIESLADEIKAIKKQKVQLLKKFKEDTENFERWKASQQRKLRVLLKKNDEKDLQIQRLKSESVKKKENDGFYKGKNLGKKRNFIGNSHNNLMNLEGLKEFLKIRRGIRKENQEIELLEKDLKEMIEKNTKLIIEMEKIQMENCEKNLDYEAKIMMENKEKEIFSEKNEVKIMIESLYENLRFRKEKQKRNSSGITQNLDSIFEEIMRKIKGFSLEKEPFFLKVFFDEFIEIYEEKLEFSEKFDEKNIEFCEFKRNFEILDQKYKVSQAQYELNLTRITAEYEERCLFLIKQQNETMMNSEGKGGIPEETSKKGIKKRDFEELLEKNLKFEKSLSGILFFVIKMGEKQ